MDNSQNDDKPAKGRAKGGRSRMNKLSSGERSDLARQAAGRRWAVTPGEVLPLVCGSVDRPADIAGVKVPCYVVGDELRVITVNGLQLALGLSASGGTPRLVEFVTKIGGNLPADNNLVVRLSSPIQFQPPNGGRPAVGYDATIIVDICDAILTARREGRLTPRYRIYAERAEVLMSAFAKTAIVALIDEATGFQYLRPRNALSEILQRYISDKFMPWTKTFPDEFYVLMFQLKGWDFSNLKPGGYKPSVVGRYTRNIVYQRLAPAVIYELERKNPIVGPGMREFKHHQWLTSDIGHPELKLHIEKVLLVMRMADDWEDFRAKLRRAMPMKWEQMELRDLFPDPMNEPPSTSDDGLD